MLLAGNCRVEFPASLGHSLDAEGLQVNVSDTCSVGIKGPWSVAMFSRLFLSLIVSSVIQDEMVPLFLFATTFH